MTCHVQSYNRQNSKFDVQELPTTQLKWMVDTNRQMTKDTTSTSQKGQSYQDTKSDSTKLRERISKRRRSYKPKYRKFFLLVFLNYYKYVINNLVHFGGSNSKYRLE